MFWLLNNGVHELLPLDACTSARGRRAAAVVPSGSSSWTLLSCGGSRCRARQRGQKLSDAGQQRRLAPFLPLLVQNDLPRPRPMEGGRAVVGAEKDDRGELALDEHAAVGGRHAAPLAALGHDDSMWCALLQRIQSGGHTRKVNVD